MLDFGGVLIWPMHSRTGSVINFVFGHNMLQRCMYADQKETGP